MTPIRSLACVFLLAMVLPREAAAQEFRIYTRVMFFPQGAPQAGQADHEVVARSVTLFHAGRVYDYIDEAGEVIVLEPAHRRCTIVNLQRDLRTTLDFEELHNLLRVGRHEAENAASRLEAEDKPASQAAARLLRFQLDPQFEERFDAERRTLTLSSPMIRYAAKCAPETPPEVADAWSKYADSMCRLNFVLHPSVLLPDPRLALNAGLSQRRLIPTAVELTIESQPRVHLRAEHELSWDLNAKDRSLIHHWETVLKRKTTKQVPLQEYQRLAAGAQTATRR